MTTTANQIAPPTAGAHRAEAASVDEIRAHFPALTRMQHGSPIAYFDGPGGTQVPQEVVDAMSDYLLHHNANTHWQYPTSQETDAMIADSRQAIADFLNSSPDEVAFGANMTTLTFHLARALGREWKAGDEVVITELDHHGNVAPWRALERERGIVIRSVRLDPETGTLDMRDLAAKLTPRAKLLAINVASNALGTITDPLVVTQMAHQAGAEVFIDAVHFAPHNLVDVKASGWDFLACSADKFYGPHIGILLGKKARIVLSASRPVRKTMRASSARGPRSTSSRRSRDAAAAGAIVFRPLSRCYIRAARNCSLGCGMDSAASTA